MVESAVVVTESKTALHSTKKQTPKIRTEQHVQHTWINANLCITCIYTYLCSLKKNKMLIRNPTVSECFKHCRHDGFSINIHRCLWYFAKWNLELFGCFDYRRLCKWSGSTLHMFNLPKGAICSICTVNTWSACGDALSVFHSSLASSTASKSHPGSGSGHSFCLWAKQLEF